MDGEVATLAVVMVVDKVDDVAGDYCDYKEAEHYPEGVLRDDGEHDEGFIS